MVVGGLGTGGRRVGRLAAESGRSGGRHPGPTCSRSSRACRAPGVWSSSCSWRSWRSRRVSGDGRTISLPTVGFSPGVAARSLWRRFRSACDDCKAATAVVEGLYGRAPCDRLPPEPYSPWGSWVDIVFRGNISSPGARPALRLDRKAGEDGAGFPPTVQPDAGHPPPPSAQVDALPSLELGGSRGFGEAAPPKTAKPDCGETDAKDHYQRRGYDQPIASSSVELRTIIWKIRTSSQIGRRIR